MGIRQLDALTFICSLGEVDDVPVMRVVQVSRVQVVMMTVVIPQLHLVEKVVVIPDVQVTQTSEKLGTARGVQLLDQFVDMPVGVPTSACGTVEAPQSQFILVVTS